MKSGVGMPWNMSSSFWRMSHSRNGFGTLPHLWWMRCTKHIQEMLDGGAIWPSQSPWCSAMVLVRKKDGSLRFCIDFHRLNARTKKDAYPLPHMQEIMESMVSTWHFSCMDLKSGFWQVKMVEESRQYTAFMVSSMGIYEFLCMPYGLCNAPATFQCLMQNCLGELNLTYALIYLDDVIAYSKIEEEHLIHPQAVLERFMESGLKLKPSKCNFFRMEISYLGAQSVHHQYGARHWWPERHHGDCALSYIHSGA